MDEQVSARERTSNDRCCYYFKLGPLDDVNKARFAENLMSEAPMTTMTTAATATQYNRCHLAIGFLLMCRKNGNASSHVFVCCFVCDFVTSTLTNNLPYPSTVSISNSCSSNVRTPSHSFIIH